MARRNSSLMTVEEVAEFFAVTPATIREWCKSGKLPASKPGKSWLIHRDQVTILLQKTYGDRSA